MDRASLRSVAIAKYRVVPRGYARGKTRNYDTLQRSVLNCFIERISLRKRKNSIRRKKKKKRKCRLNAMRIVSLCNTHINWIVKRTRARKSLFCQPLKVTKRPAVSSRPERNARTNSATPNLAERETYHTSVFRDR